jgi:hypothetical protein
MVEIGRATLELIEEAARRAIRSVVDPLVSVKMIDPPRKLDPKGYCSGTVCVPALMAAGCAFT